MSEPSHLWSMQYLGHLWAIDFVGGALDGHKHVTSLAPEELAELAYVPVNAHLVGRLTGEADAQERPVTSVAVYQLRPHEGMWRYEHLRTAAVADSELNHWMV